MISAEDMADLHAAAFTQSRPWTAAEFADLMAHPACFVVGDTRAFAVIRVILDEAELLTLTTRPEVQRQGLARRLMADWHDIAAARGATRGFLEVAATNHPARALYEACGYDEVGLRRTYYAQIDGTGIDAVLMARDFAGYATAPAPVPH